MVAEERKMMVEKEYQRQRATTRSPSLSPPGENDSRATVSMAMTTHDEESNSGGDHSLEDNDVALLRSPTKQVTSLVAPPPSMVKKQFCIENILADKISSLHRRQHPPFPCVTATTKESFIRCHQEGAPPTTTNNKDYNEPIIISTRFCGEAATVLTPPSLLTFVKNE